MKTAEAVILPAGGGHKVPKGLGKGLDLRRQNKNTFDIESEQHVWGLLSKDNNHEKDEAEAEVAQTTWIAIAGLWAT